MSATSSRARLTEEPKKEVPSKASFVRTVLDKNPDANTSEVAEKWKEAGYPADKAPTSSDITQVKASIKKKKAGLPSRARLTAGGEAKSDGKLDLAWYISVEDALEDMILDAKRRKDKDVLEWMRKARRRASLKILQLQGEA